ncbi:Molybdenum import ABC transporter, ATP-binding protein [gamma proteobacterium HdN1]|nr:Molybdenum import ABC transporter, ATP-binding protein [gamma proteobacterium HdN1]
MQLDIDFRKTLVAGKRRFDLQVSSHSDCKRIVLHGPSGSGKSLTLKAIAGLMTPDYGYIRLNGVTLFDSAQGVNLSVQARRLGYVFQDYALFPHLNVRQNISFGLRRGWFNPHSQVAYKEVEHWLDALGLRQVALQIPEELSGGQRQRTALARALVTRPQALLLDEPFSALDPDLRQAMRDELDGLQRQLDIPVILITHDAAEREQFGDHVVRMDAGRVAGLAGEGMPLQRYA